MLGVKHLSNLDGSFNRSLFLFGVSGDVNIELTNGSGVYFFGSKVTIPEHCRLNVFATTHGHTYISTSDTYAQGVVADQTRAPPTIHMRHYTIVTSEFAGSGRSQYTNIVVSAHASLKFRGVTMVEDVGASVDPASPGIDALYDEGVIVLRGHSASVSLCK